MEITHNNNNDKTEKAYVWVDCRAIDLNIGDVFRYKKDKKEYICKDKQIDCEGITEIAAQEIFNPISNAKPNKKLKYFIADDSIGEIEMRKICICNCASNYELAFAEELKVGDTIKRAQDVDTKLFVDAPLLTVTSVQKDATTNTYSVNVSYNNGMSTLHCSHGDVFYRKKRPKENKKCASGMTTKDDPVNHPAHYTQGKIEVIDFISDQKLNYNLGNALKYLCRCNYKGKKIEDLHKAIWYLEREIKDSQ